MTAATAMERLRAERGEPSAHAVTVGPPARTWTVPAAVGYVAGGQARTAARAGRDRRRNRQPSAVTAAAKIVTDNDRADAAGNAARRTGAGWQDEAWSYYDLVGELHYAASFIGACLSRVRLTPGKLGTDGKPGPAFDDAGAPLIPLAEVAQAAIAGLRSTVGGQPQLMRSFGLNLSVAGETWLVGTDIIDQATRRPVGRQWEVLSTSELRQQADGKLKRVPVPGGTAEDLPPNTFTCRVWRSHPRWSSLPDSSVRGVLEILEELLLLTRKVRVETVSRLAGAGVMFVPDEISETYKRDVDDDPDGDEGDDPFTADLLQTMMAPIADPTSAAAYVPMVVTAPGDAIEKVRWLVRPEGGQDDAGLADKRREAVIRLAQGLDLPVEIVTGHMQTTFANAAQIDEATWKAHIEPLVELICDALTVGYLRPLLLAGGADPVQVAGMVVTFDASELVTHPNREQAADAGYGSATAPAFAISGQAWRRVHGFAEGDAPDDDEIQERVDIARQLHERVSVPAAASDAPPTDIRFDPESGSATPAASSGDAVTAAGLAVRVAAAAEVAVERAAERAGARLRSKADTHPGARRLIDGVPNSHVGLVLGADLVATLGITADQLLAGEFSAFARSVARWAAEAGVADVDGYTTGCVAHVERIAATRLFRPAAVDVGLFTSSSAAA